MSSLLGIALITDDEKMGPRVVFRYPPNGGKGEEPGGLNPVSQFNVENDNLNGNGGNTLSTPSNVNRSYNDPKPGTDIQQQRQNRSFSIDTVGVETAKKSSYQEQRKKKSIKDIGHFFEIPPAVLSKLFRPKSKKLMNRTLEVVINNFRFISYPMLVKDESSRPRAISSQIIPEEHELDDNEKTLRSFAVVFVLNAEMSQISSESCEILSIDPGPHYYGVSYPGSRKSVAMYEQVVKKLSHALLFEELRNNYISNELSKILQVQESFKRKIPNLKVRNLQNLDQAAAEGSRPYSNSLHSPQSKDNDSIPGSSSPYTALFSSAPYNNKTPRTKRNSVSYEKSFSIDEARRIGLKDYDIESIDSYNKHILSDLHVTDSIISVSTLAGELKKVFDGLKRNRVIHLQIQGWLSISLAMNDMDAKPTAELKPFQTLLIISPKDLICEIEEQPNSSNQLVSMIKYFSTYGPLVSFDEMSKAHSLPISQVFKLANHLCFWQKAIIMDTLNKQSIFQVSPSTSFSIEDNKWGIFNLLFAKVIEKNKDLNLGKVLSYIAAPNQSSHTPKRFGELLASCVKELNITEEEFMSIFVWLLQKGMLIQMKQYIYFLAPEFRNGQSLFFHGNSSSSDYSVLGGTMKSKRNLSVGDTKTLLKPGGSSDKTSPKNTNKAIRKHYIKYPNECIYVNNLLGDDHAAKLFRKLFHYFLPDIAISIEEIMYIEQVSREELALLLEEFKEVLNLCLI
jgi:hypothetical protein